MTASTKTHNQQNTQLISAQLGQVNPTLDNSQPVWNLRGYQNTFSDAIRRYYGGPSITGQASGPGLAQVIMERPPIIKNNEAERIPMVKRLGMGI